MTFLQSTGFWQVLVHNCSVSAGEESDRVDEVGRRLIVREEQLFSQDSTSEDNSRLQKDFEDLTLQIWTTVQNTFTSSSSSGQLDQLRNAVACIQQQEVQDRRWTDRPEDRLPVWRPLKCISAHNTLLHNLVESRLTEAAEDESGGTEGFSSPLKREVRHVKSLRTHRPSLLLSACC